MALDDVDIGDVDAYIKEGVVEQVKEEAEEAKIDSAVMPGWWDELAEAGVLLDTVLSVMLGSHGNFPAFLRYLPDNAYFNGPQFQDGTKKAWVGIAVAAPVVLFNDGGVAARIPKEKWTVIKRGHVAYKELDRRNPTVFGIRGDPQVLIFCHVDRLQKPQTMIERLAMVLHVSTADIQDRLHNIQKSLENIQRSHNGAGGRASSHKVVIQGLPPDVTEDALRTTLIKLGWATQSEVFDITVEKDLARVNFHSGKTAVKLVESHGLVKMKGKVLRVTWDRESDAVAFATWRGETDRQAMRCPECKSINESKFITNHRSGDVICTDCGVIVQERAAHQGSWIRNFDDDTEDKSQHGQAPDPLMSHRYNSRTFIEGSAGKVSKRMRHAQNFVEMNGSALESEVKRTRIGYKDQQKIEAFNLMKDLAESLEMHDGIVLDAKATFSQVRDDKEALMKYKATVAACLLRAFDKAKKAGNGVVQTREQYGAMAAAQRKRQQQQQKLQRMKKDAFTAKEFRCLSRWQWLGLPREREKNKRPVDKFDHKWARSEHAHANADVWRDLPGDAGETLEKIREKQAALRKSLSDRSKYPTPEAQREAATLGMDRIQHRIGELDITIDGSLYKFFPAAQDGAGAGAGAGAVSGSGSGSAMTDVGVVRQQMRGAKVRHVRILLDKASGLTRSLVIPNNAKPKGTAALAATGASAATSTSAPAVPVKPEPGAAAAAGAAASTTAASSSSSSSSSSTTSARARLQGRRARGRAGRAGGIGIGMRGRARQRVMGAAARARAVGARAGLYCRIRLGMGGPRSEAEAAAAEEGSAAAGAGAGEGASTTKRLVRKWEAPQKTSFLKPCAEPKWGRRLRFDVPHASGEAGEGSLPPACVDVELLRKTGRRDKHLIAIARLYDPCTTLRTDKPTKVPLYAPKVASTSSSSSCAGSGSGSNGTAASSSSSSSSSSLGIAAVAPACVVNGEPVGYVWLQLWESRVRRREGCKQKFNSMRDKRFHRCPSTLKRGQAGMNGRLIQHNPQAKRRKMYDERTA